jgi:glycosyltransferase involved in cell wall biosynthesis
LTIVIVCDFAEVNGGAAKVAITSARALAEAGQRVVYVCAMAPVSATLRHPGITVHCLGLENVWQRRNPLLAALQGIWNRRARRGFEEILRDLPREGTIVHFHQWTKALSPSVLIAPVRYGLPAVVTLHDYFLACPNGAYYHFRAGKPCRLRPLSGACTVSACDRAGYAHKLVRLFRQWATRAALARCGASLSLLNVSARAATIVEPFLPKNHRRLTITSPIEISHQPPVDVARNRSFVFVGRLTEEKGVRQLAELAHAARLPLTIIGEGPLGHDLQQLGETIRCTGWLEGAALEAIMREARVLVFPSTWYETTGLVVLEALARGIPAVVSRRTAATDFVSDDVNGFTFDPDDRDGLLACLRRLEQDDALVARLGREAYRRYWADPLSDRSHVAKLMAAYARLERDRGAQAAALP